MGSSEIHWDKIVGYSLSNNSDFNFLTIKHINSFQKAIKTKYRIAVIEQEKVNKIFQDKLDPKYRSNPASQK